MAIEYANDTEWTVSFRSQVWELEERAPDSKLNLWSCCNPSDFYETRLQTQFLRISSLYSISLLVVESAVLTLESNCRLMHEEFIGNNVVHFNIYSVYIFISHCFLFTLLMLYQGCFKLLLMLTQDFLLLLLDIKGNTM